MDGELIRFAVMSAMGILCLGTILDFIYALVKIWLEHRVQKNKNLNRTSNIRRFKWKQIF